MQKIQISSEYAYHILILMNLCLHLISLQKFAKKKLVKNSQKFNNEIKDISFFLHYFQKDA